MTQAKIETQPTHGVPEGWVVVDIGGGEIVVQAPDADSGGITVSPKDRALANRLLYELGRAILDQAAGQAGPKHHINASKTVAVATDYFWTPMDAHTPRGVKLQLLGKGGVAMYAIYTGREPFFTDWAPLPKKRHQLF